MNDFSKIWLPLAERFYRVAYHLLESRDDAEDAVQETFLKVYRSMGTFRGNCSEKTWIMKIAMHACYDINRSGWFRLINRRITPDMLPEPAAAETSSFPPRS